VAVLAEGGLYRQKAAEMHAQAERAETPYLKGVYAVIAENWDQLAAQMEAGTALAGKNSPESKL
jgi:hypothetical protein